MIVKIINLTEILEDKIEKLFSRGNKINREKR